MAKRCIIISGGEKSPIPKIEENDFIIACDKGYEYAKDADIVPNLLIGDFDSYNGDIDENIPILRYKKEKDDTDTQLAVRFAAKKRFQSIDICCALGGRLDHLYSNLQSAAFAAEKGISVRITDSSTYIYFLSGKSIELEKKEGYSISVFSHSDVSTGVTIRGTKYDIENLTFTNSFPLGVCNEWKDEKATVSVKTGVLMIMLSKY